jgi:hypothetical protein
MKTPYITTIVVLTIASLPSFAEVVNAQEDSRKQAAWVRQVKERSERGSLHDAFQYVRGDSGRWSDDPLLLTAPITQRPERAALDDWFDDLLEGETSPAMAGDEQWLLFRTRQLDDNDRVWVERFERNGNRFTIVLNEAIWQGKYFKTFTYYSVFGVNLGKLQPGEYEVHLIIQPLEFRQFDGDRPSRENWPKDERRAEGSEPSTLRTTVRVTP